MTFREFLADINSDFSKYSEAGLIDEADVLKWVERALKKFGATIMIYQECVVEVENYKGVIPSNFFSLSNALLCTKDKIICSNEEDKSKLVKSFFWTDVQLKKKGWELCTEECCENKIEEFTIREKTYMRDFSFDRTYKDPIKLRLSPQFKKSVCDTGCLGNFREDSINEINIIGNILHTNFKEGDVYIKYKGLELDEEGLVIIPDTPKGEVETYVTVFVKRNILENIAMNGDDPNVASLLSYYANMEKPQLLLALTESKFLTLTPQSMYRLRDRNITERRKFERIPRN